MPNEIDDKLAQCHRAQRALAVLQERQDVDEFEYHFCSFIGFFGAVRQYIQERLRLKLLSPNVEPEQTWLQSLESDVAVATIIGLRNTDVHRDVIRVTNQRVEVALSATLKTSGSLSFVAHDAAGKVFASGFSDPESTPNPLNSATPPVLIEFKFCLNPANLPADFMTADHDRKDGRVVGSKVQLTKGDDLPMKAAVVSHLAGTHLGSVATAAIATLEAAIIGARSGSQPNLI